MRTIVCDTGCDGRVMLCVTRHMAPATRLAGLDWPLASPGPAAKTMVFSSVQSFCSMFIQSPAWQASLGSFRTSHLPGKPV